MYACVHLDIVAHIALNVYLPVSRVPAKTATALNSLMPLAFSVNALLDLQGPYVTLQFRPVLHSHVLITPGAMTTQVTVTFVPAQQDFKALIVRSKSTGALQIRVRILQNAALTLMALTNALVHRNSLGSTVRYLFSYVRRVRVFKVCVMRE